MALHVLEPTSEDPDDSPDDDLQHIMDNYPRELNSGVGSKLKHNPLRSTWDDTDNEVDYGQAAMSEHGTYITFGSYPISNNCRYSDSIQDPFLLRKGSSGKQDDIYNEGGLVSTSGSNIPEI